MRHISKKTKKMKEVEQRTGECVEEVLRRLYVDENLTHDEIGEKLNLTYSNVFSWLRKAGIYSRKLSLE